MMKFFWISILWLVIIRMASKSIACVKCANLTFSRFEKVSCRCILNRHTIYLYIHQHTYSVCNFVFFVCLFSRCFHCHFFFEMYIIQIFERSTMIIIIHNVNERENEKKKRIEKQTKWIRVPSTFSIWRTSEPQKKRYSQ